MKKSLILPSLRKRILEFKNEGCDLRLSRRYILKKSCIRSGNVLEVGTGKGHLTALLAAVKKLKVISIDYDASALKIARSHLKELKLDRRAVFRKINAEKLPFAPLSFDHVISADFFHHAKKPLRCLREMTRVAKKTVTLADFNQKGFWMMERIHRKEGKTHPRPKIPFSRLKKDLLKAGFDVKSYRHVCHQIFVAKRRKS